MNFDDPYSQVLTSNAHIKTCSPYQFAKSQEFSKGWALPILERKILLSVLNSWKILECDLLSPDSVAKSATQKPSVFWDWYEVFTNGLLFWTPQKSGYNFWSKQAPLKQDKLKVHICLSWESKTVQNSTLLIFSKYHCVFPIMESLFTTWLIYLKSYGQKCRNSI